MDHLTQAYLKQRINYNPISGEFIWKEMPIDVGLFNSNFAGKKAGHVRKTPNKKLSYLEIKLDGKIYRAHRLAFLYMEGAFPLNQVDHKDGNSLNNCWKNLRHATSSENCANYGKQSNNTSGFKGVSLVKATGKYHSYITIHRQRINIGFFKTAQEASDAYKTAALKYFGEFAKW